jgi:transposase-like protein
MTANAALSHLHEKYYIKQINNVQRPLFSKGNHSSSCLFQVKVYLISYRDIEELLRIRGVIVDHATIWWFWLQILFHNVAQFVVF